MPSDETAELQEKLVGCLARFPRIRAAYLFGSQVTGRARPDSDVDLAFSAEEGADRTRLKLDVLDALTQQLGSVGERIDLLDLDEAGSTIAFRVIRDGRLIYAPSDKERTALEARIARRYDDERQYRELFRRAARSLAKFGANGGG